MKINCPSCSKEYTIDERHLGKQVKCTNCETLFRIPSSPEEMSSQESRTDTLDKRQDSDIPSQKTQEAQLDTQKDITHETLEDESITSQKEEASDTSDFQAIHLKPKYLSFIFFSNPLIYFFWIISIVSLIVSIFFIEFIGIFIVSTLLTIIWLFLISIVYKKEQYHLEADHIAFDFWGIFSDNSMELKYNKITQVTLHQRFLERYIFHTGTIKIWNAWSSQSFVSIKNIINSQKCYEDIQERMRANGFSLKKENLVQKEKPHWIWVIGELALWTLVVLYVEIILFPIVLVYFILKYLDLMNRVYDVYDDCIVYNEWFLDHRYSILPMEVISDAQNQQSFFARIFWLHNIVISSEGSKNKVYFTNMKNGEKIAKNILYLKKNYYFLADNDTLSSWERTQKDTVYDLNYDTQYQDVLHPNILRSIIWWAFRNIFTKFHIEENAFQSRYEFFTTQSKTFTSDKVSKVIFHENIIDMIFWTCSIEFDSLGSSSALMFRHIGKKYIDRQKILAKVWIYETEDLTQQDIRFSFWTYLKSHAYLVMLVLPIIYLVLAYLYYALYYSQRFYKIHMSDTFIRKASWIIFRSTEYATYNNIKNIYTRKSPLTTNGEIRLVVWWDSDSQVSGNKSGKLSYLQFTNAVTLSYVDNCFARADEIEAIIAKRDIDTDLIQEYKQDVRNSLLFPIVFLLLPVIALIQFIDYTFFILLIPVFILLWLIMYYIRSVRYLILQDKIVKVFWIIFYSQKSILYQRINLVEKNQWPVWKIFSNGSIKIFSKWSSQAELNLVNIKDYHQLYQHLNKYTK